MAVDVSVVIPSRNEQFLAQTCRDLLEKAAGNVEVIAVLDGYWPPADAIVPGVRYVHRGESRGMRAGINAGVAVSAGEFILKADGHCLFDESWDTKLAADCEDDWVVVPRRKRLDAENWCVQEINKPDIDYMYLSYPGSDAADWGAAGLNGKIWEEKNKDAALKNIEIDDLMSAQGSGWFMPRAYFHALELMDEASYGTFWNEFQEIGLKCWLSGGRVIVNKKTWYAHLHKGKQYGRGYFLDKRQLDVGGAYTRRWLYGTAWHKATLPISWLIEKFWPVPTWPDDRELWAWS